MLALTAPALLLAGFASSPHCLLMCAPLQAMALRGARGLPARQAMALLHGGRLLGYTGLGALAGAFGAAGMRWLPDLAYGRVLQLGAAAALFVSALLLWRRRRPACAAHAPAAHIGTMPTSRTGLLLRGLAWAAVPCGFIYAMLGFASLSGGALQGAIALAAFGLGTVPLAGLGGGLLGRVQGIAPGRLQRCSSVVLALVALASAFTALGHGPSALTAWCLAP